MFLFCLGSYIMCNYEVANVCEILRPNCSRKPYVRSFLKLNSRFSCMDSRCK